jgi:hypothetical protein
MARARDPCRKVVDGEAPVGCPPKRREARGTRRDNAAAAGMEVSIGAGARDLSGGVRHRRWQEASSSGARGAFACVAELGRRGAEDLREHGARCVVEAETAAELTGVVPAHGLLRRSKRRDGGDRARGDLDEELDGGTNVHAGFGVHAAEGEAAARVGDDDA